MSLRTSFCVFSFCLLISYPLNAQNYPDQHYVLRIDSLVQYIETNDGLELSGDGKRLLLQPDRTDGYIVLRPQYAQQPFNHGLPSWNGSAPENSSSFKIQMRFPYGTGWSPWLTVGFWRANVWSAYGSTGYGGGLVDYDYVKLNSYVSAWQFKIIMTRTGVGQSSPTLYKLSFAVSDSRTTSSLDFNQILNDKPAAILIPTNFIYQYDVDPDIGGSICSPTSVSMILRSYNITVDPLQFARATLDPWYNIFGIWPRVVQNAAEYGLDGAVTRYRTWSQARGVLANGGRIAMSVGLPLYSGHLMMLAGFNTNGDPIVHDPAKSNGYSYVFNKSDLSHSWFDKGGVAYTFFPDETQVASADQTPVDGSLPDAYRLFQNYPNPFNPSTTIQFSTAESQFTTLKVFDLLGREVSLLVDQKLEPGVHSVTFDASGLPSGVYFYRMEAGNFVQTMRLVILK